MGQYDNVIDEATRSADDGNEVLDRLVPPPRPWSTRALLWIAFATLVFLGVRAVQTGTVTPRLTRSYVTHRGGTGPVSVGFQTTNRSQVDIEIVDGPRVRPGLQLLGYTVGEPGPGEPLDESAVAADPFPIRLRPGDVISLTVWFDVTDCAAVTGISRDDRSIDIQVRIADGPFSAFTTTRQIGDDMFSPRWSGAVPEETSWPAVVAQHACPDPN